MAQRAILYKSVQELNGNAFVLSLTLPFGGKMKIEWLVMKWGCHGKKGQVITNLNCYLTFYFEIQLRTTVSDSLNTSHKTFSCLVVEEMFKWKEYTH